MRNSLLFVTILSFSTSGLAQQAKLIVTDTKTYEGSQASIDAAIRANAGTNTDAKKKDQSPDTVTKCENVSSSDAAYSSCSSAYGTCNMISPQNAMLIQQALQSVKSSVSSSMGSTDPVAMDNSAASSCKIGAAMAGVAGAATLALAVMCETKVASCKRNNKPGKKPTEPTGNPVTAEAMTKYEQDLDDYKALTANHGVCSGLDANWAMDGLQALNYFASYEQNSQCAKFYTQAAKDAVPKTCQEEPTRPDCVCVINPNDPSCLGQTAGLAATTGFSDSNLRGNAASSADDKLTGLDPVGATAGSPQAGSALPGANGGANGPSLLGGKGTPEEPGGNGAGPYNTNVISGTTSGGGGNPYSRGVAEGGGENNSLLSALANKLNLKKYLPGGQARGLASVGADGKTSANGPSLWDKASYQYRRQQNTVNP